MDDGPQPRPADVKDWAKWKEKVPAETSCCLTGHRPYRLFFKVIEIFTLLLVHSTAFCANFVYAFIII